MPKGFDDLDYPGRKRPMNRAPLNGGPSLDDHSWATNPTKYPFKGEMREFYTISHLAKALDKSPVTIRSWEQKGLLPVSSLRSPRPRRAPLGTPARGRRLWTYEQIAGILRIAQEEQCILNGLPPTLGFAKKVDKLFTQLHTQLQKESSNGKR